MPPDPPRCLRLRRSRGALRRQENIHVRCFQKYVRYFTKQLKILSLCNVIVYFTIVCKMSIMSTDKITKPFIVNANLVSLSITGNSKK